jgi:Flp pilus assembly protein TadG
MALVAVAMFSIIAMAGLAIDVGTLYEASAEAQRSADAAALAAARVLSVSGMTGDPTNSSGDWALACAAATQMAKTVARQDTVGGSAPSTVNVTFTSSDGSDCGNSGLVAFGVNPMVTVKVTQSSLPTYFSRIWGVTGSSAKATATAEAFNPSNSESFAPGGNVIPVQPRCVKPWVVPNLDPGNASNPFVSTAAATQGSIMSGGIRLSGVGTGVIGEVFTLVPDCNTAGACNSGLPYSNPPIASPTPPTLYYLPGAVPAASAAVPSCGNANPYQQAVAGCDETTVYQCGVPHATATNPNQVDISENPALPASDTTVAAQCLTYQSPGAGQDTLVTTSYPYQIVAGPGNPLGVSGTQITTSNSIVSLPIYDGTTLTFAGTVAPVTIVGFLQVFINFVGSNGTVNATVLNVAGCGNGTPTAVSSPPLYGSSPVPVRLITPP